MSEHGGTTPVPGEEPVRRMFRYEVLIDDQPHEFWLTSSPVAVAAAGPRSVEFWCEHTTPTPRPGRSGRGQFVPVRHAFQVFGTGQPLPENARWAGTCRRTELGLVWHLYEVPAP